jgi:hypothetical protein
LWLGLGLGLGLAAVCVSIGAIIAWWMGYLGRPGRN